jgi:hypothetical protein
MGYEVEFRNVKVIADVKSNKNVFVGMETAQSICEKSKCQTSVDGILHKVQEVQHCMQTSDESEVGNVIRKANVNNETKKKLADLVMFMTSNM